MEKQIKIWTVEKGEPTEIEMDGKIFSIHLKGAGVVEHRPTSSKLQKRKRGRYISNCGGPDLGSVVAVYRDFRIRKNPLEKIKQVRDDADIKTILREYHPFIGPESIARYCVFYKGYLKTKTLKIVKKRKHKGHRQKPADAYGYSEKYGTWVKKDEAEKVRLAVSKVDLNYKPTAKVIMDGTHMTRRRVMSALDVLKENGVIIVTKEQLKRIYRLPYSAPESILV